MITKINRSIDNFCDHVCAFLGSYYRRIWVRNVRHFGLLGYTNRTNSMGVIRVCACWTVVSVFFATTHGKKIKNTKQKAKQSRKNKTTKHRQKQHQKINEQSQRESRQKDILRKGKRELGSSRSSDQMCSTV